MWRFDTIRLRFYCYVCCCHRCCYCCCCHFSVSLPMSLRFQLWLHERVMTKCKPSQSPAHSHWLTDSPPPLLPLPRSLPLFLPHSVCNPIRSTKLRQLRAIHNPQSACIVHFVGEGSEVGWQRWRWWWWWLRRLLISGQSYQFTIRIQFAYYFGICDKPLAFSCHLKRS